MTAYIHDLWDDAPDLQVFIESVHLLSNLGAVITQAAHGTSQHGFEAEWREKSIFTFDGDLLSRCEIFDEADLDAALAKFEELSRPTPRLENAASRVTQRFLGQFAQGNWDAVAEKVADDFSQDDRRRVVGAGVRHGRDAEIVDLRAIASLRIAELTSTVMATRGERLVLVRCRFAFGDQGPEGFVGELLGVAEINADEQIVAAVSFDLDDFEAAIAELDARYLAGEAAAHSHTWSVISQAYLALNRRALPATTPGWTSIDHRRFGTVEANALTPNIRAWWDLTSEARIDVETVHQLTSLGAVVTQATHATWHEGAEIESGEIVILMVDDDLLSRCELFDEADIEAALARFEELHLPARRLENTATQVYARLHAYFVIRDWAAITEILCDGYYQDDAVQW